MIDPIRSTTIDDTDIMIVIAVSDKVEEGGMGVEVVFVVQVNVSPFGRFVQPAQLQKLPLLPQYPTLEQHRSGLRHPAGLPSSRG